MSSTDYSYFNFNNYAFSGASSINFDYNMLHQYSVNGIPLLTYLLVGVTAVTLGYITLTEHDIEPTINPPPVEPPKVVGGKKKKSKTEKRKKKGE